MDSGQHADRQSPGILRTFLSLLVMVAFVFGLSWVLRTYVFQAYEIPSGSMEETIMVGDMVFSEKVSYYFRDPEPGDIVTFQDPEIPGRVLIKRCIAVGGRPWTSTTRTASCTWTAWRCPNRTPAVCLLHAGQRRLLSLHGARGYLWMMGDNRTNSQDSRFFGAIPVSSVTGRGALVYWPLNDFSLLD